MRVADLSFDQGNASTTFHLADGHEYYLHRVIREDKPPVYALMGLTQLQAMSPYINEQLMDTVLEKRGSAERKVTAVEPWVSETGFICPGCGAKVSKDGAHFPPDSAPEPKGEPEPLPEPEPEPEPSPKRRRSRFIEE